MYLKLLKNDFKKNPWSNFVLFLFMSLSAAIAVAVALMLSQLFTSISSMYETAKPPHFLQMHKGELVQSDIDEFNKNYAGIEHWQTVSMINIYGDELTVSNSAGNSFTLSDCRLDISLVKQNEMYDVLLDENRSKLEINPGEIGVPVIILDQYDISIGDKITLSSGEKEKSFTVVSYVYDGQMNSTLCSSTRFLLSDKDFAELSGSVGETEYLIEAYFTESSLADDYQTAYEQSEKNLPKNGQAITYIMIFLLSAMTDLLMAVVFILTGVLLIVIAVICLRHTVLAELEDDMREIGTMKAMGISGKGICNLYLSKIRILMACGCVLGFLLALVAVSALTGHISRTFGEQNIGMASYGLAILVCAAVYGVILAFSRKILKRLQKASVTDLLVAEKGFGKRTEAKDGLRRIKRVPINMLISLHEVRKGYGIIFGLLLIVSFLIAVPHRTVQTMENEKFITYMGSPICDLLLEVEQGDRLEERNAAAENMLRAEMLQDNIENIDILRRVRLQAIGNDGKLVGIHIDTGKSAGRGLRYLNGEEPKSRNDIALSYLMADKLEKSQGDKIILIVNGIKQEFSICGIYQDVTSGGSTAKTICAFASEPAEKYTYQIKTNNTDGLEQMSARLQKQLGSGYSVENMEEFVGQTLGGVSSQIEQAAYAVFFIGVCLTALIALLFLKLRMAKEAGALAAKRTIGIPFFAICLQELYPVLIAGGIGAVIGVFLAEVLGDDMISALFGIMGVGLKRIEFVSSPVWQQFIIPAALISALTIVTGSVCMQIKKIDVTSHFNE